MRTSRSPHDLGRDFCRAALADLLRQHRLWCWQCLIREVVAVVHKTDDAEAIAQQFMPTAEWML